MEVLTSAVVLQGVHQVGVVEHQPPGLVLLLWTRAGEEDGGGDGGGGDGGGGFTALVLC